MKKLALIALFLALPVLPVMAQSTSPTASVTQPANGPANIAGLLYAANFAHWTISPTPQGTRWDSPGQCYGTSGGVVFPLFSTTAPITIVDVGVPTNTETVTPSLASYLGSGCSVSLPATHSHSNYYLQSGTLGLQEALNFAGSTYAMVVVTPDWQAMGGTTAMINAAVAGSNTTVLDERGPIIYSVTNASAAPATTRTLVGNITENYHGSVTTTGSLVGVRGYAVIGANTTMAGQSYVYGAQGKVQVNGTLNGSDWVAGLDGQLDLSGSPTLTAAAHLTPLWSDAGATAPSGTCAFCDGMVITNTTAATFHDLIYGYSKAAYFADLTDNGGGYLIIGSASSAAVTGYIKVKINGSDAYIRVYAGTN